MRILLIDDNAVALKVLGIQVRNLGFEGAVACASGAAAVAALEQDAAGFGLVVCDLQMPEMDGIEVIRHMARLKFAGALVILSAEPGRVLNTAERLANAHGLRVVAALEKPVSADALAAALSQFVQAAPRARPAPAVYDADDLQRALDEGQFFNVYQPKVEVATGSVYGVESLVRWQHPTNGVVYPDQFISLAEDHGLINTLTRQVLARALEQAAAWIEAGLDLSVAVNVSMDDLTDLRFPDWVADLVAAHRIPPTRVVLEVTESRLMKDARAPLDILTRLRLKRVRLSIDDFGTGHSSLAQLRDFPFDELKVDRGFVHGASRSASLRAIFDGSCVMARQLGMTVVAEGVEDQRDWDFLRSAGCDLAQGYFIARPMAGDRLPDWIRTWQAPR